MCCVCVAGYFSLARPGITTRWEKEPAPPEPISRLELGNAGEILGFTADETLYEFTYGAYQAESSWNKVEQPSGTAPLGDHCSPETQDRIIVSPPGEVASRVSESCTYIESGYQLEIVLLENGEIWSWEHEMYAYAMLANAFILFIVMMGGVLILAAGIGWTVYKFIRSKYSGGGT